MIAPFELGRLPRLTFGEGSRARIPELATRYGSRVLVVTGARSLRASVHGRALFESFRTHGLQVHALAVAHEPSPTLIDDAVREHRARGIDVVVGIGGGSALDAAKAIAGLLPTGNSVLDHLEEIGRGLPYEGPAIPFIAAPTTAGTGSEATRNAVISDVSGLGFKRSFRHEVLVPSWAVIDPDLLATCPRALIAADGMDALTQLLESWTSPRANAFTDVLAERGLRMVREGLLSWYQGIGDARAARSAMAYAAFLSGVTLAHAGLGIVHGLSAPLGGRFPIPHGVACGTLLAAATRTNVAAIRTRDPHAPALSRYARAWSILSGATGVESELPDDAPERLVAVLEEWTAHLELHQARLSTYGVTESELPGIVAEGRGGSTKTNPVALEDTEVMALLRSRL